MKALNKINQCLYPIRYNYPAIAVIVVYMLGQQVPKVFAESAEFFPQEKILIQLGGVSTKMLNISNVGGVRRGSVPTIDSLNVSEPYTKKSTKIIPLSAGFALSNEPVGDSGSNNTAKSNSREIGKGDSHWFTHGALFIGLLILCGCAGASLVLQWKTWVIVRRTHGR